MATPKRCRICLSRRGPWTAEDVVPKWQRKFILETIRSLPIEIPPELRIARRVLLKPVCETCQRRLNFLFEKPAHELLKSMMSGSAILLTPRQQVILAGWFVKTDLLFNLARYRPEGQRPVRERSFNEVCRMHLLLLLEEGAPPENASARLASG